MAYGTRDGLEQIYGRDNVHKWADLDNNGSAVLISSRIEWALTLAENQLNSRLSQCAYTVPFTGTVDPIIVDMTNRLAGVLLYDSRGLVDVDPEEMDQLTVHRKKVDHMVRQIHGGQVKLLSHEVQAVNYAQSVPLSTE